MIKHLQNYYILYKELMVLSSEVDTKINKINDILDGKEVELKIEDIEQEIAKLKTVINFKINELNKLRDEETN